ncbi:MAG: transposase, partial [Salinibacter sp.]
NSLGSSACYPLTNDTVATGAENPSLGEVMGAFKSLTTNADIHGVRHQGWPPFDRRLWQRNYHERVIRDEDELARLRRYIQANPARWGDDPENPSNQPDDNSWRAR